MSNSTSLGRVIRISTPTSVNASQCASDREVMLLVGKEDAAEVEGKEEEEEERNKAPALGVTAKTVVPAAVGVGGKAGRAGGEGGGEVCG